MLFEQIKASPLQPQWKDEFDAQLWARPRHWRQSDVVDGAFHSYCSTHCGCNQRFHPVPVSCHSYKVHAHTVGVCQWVSFARCNLQTKRCLLYYRIHIEFACSEVCSLCHPRALCYWNDYYYFSCQRWTQNVSVLFFYCIPQLFSYNYPGYAVIYVHFIFVLLSPITLSFVLYDGWIKLYCNKTNCHHKHLSVVFFYSNCYYFYFQ